MQVTKKRHGLTVFLSIVAMISALLASATSSAKASAVDWYASAKSAAYAFDGSSGTVVSVENALFSLVDQAGPDPAAWWDIMNGLDDQIGNPARENQWSIKIIRDTEQKIVSLIADMTPYTGTPTDDVWKEIPGVLGWEIRALGPNAALLKRGGKGFLWTRPGSAEFTQSDYTLGLKRYAWSDSSNDGYTEPGSSQTMSVSLGNVPTNVKVGDTIALTPTFSVTPWRITYSWTVECGGVADTSLGTSSYVVKSSDLNCGIVVDVGASKAGYYPAGASSFDVVNGLISVGPGTTPPVLKVFSKTYAPTISGTAKVGKTLTASVKTWSPKASFRYQWLSEGVAIDGATSRTYKLVAADLGSTISVTATGTRSGYVALTKASSPTKVVALGSLARGKVKVTGTRRVGKTLTAKTWSWSSGSTPFFQWYKNSHAIDGAIAKTYTLSPTDRGARFKVKVWTTKDGYAPSSSRTSARTAKVKTGYLSKITPIISGNAVIDQTLTANTGAWKPPETAFRYQWYRSGKKVTGATGATYLLTANDRGKTIKVKVTGSATGYYTSSRYSKSTAKVVSPTPPPPPPSTVAPSPTPTSTP